MQPEDLPKQIAQFGCFVMPSLYEAWGVAIHEAASAGLPLILSSVTGAGTIFLEEAVNGFSFESGNEKALKNSLLNIINSNDDALMLMSQRSAKLSAQITPEIWANTFKQIQRNAIS